MFKLEKQTILVLLASIYIYIILHSDYQLDKVVVYVVQHYLLLVISCDSGSKHFPSAATDVSQDVTRGINVQLVPQLSNFVCQL